MAAEASDWPGQELLRTAVHPRSRFAGRDAEIVTDRVHHPNTRALASGVVKTCCTK